MRLLGRSQKNIDEAVDQRRKHVYEKAKDIILTSAKLGQLFSKPSSYVNSRCRSHQQSIAENMHSVLRYFSCHMKTNEVRKQ